MFIAGIIPARYASTRLPGKPLAVIKGKPMIQHVYERSAEALGYVAVATDDDRIKDAVMQFGGRVVMTSREHRSGTDRCAEAVVKISDETGEKPDAVINIQGDEPFIKPGQISQLAEAFNDPSVHIATLIKQIDNNEELFDPALPKVVFNIKNEALYFSRWPLPYVRDVEKNSWTEKFSFYRHLGMYGYRTATLTEIAKLMPSPLECAESLEQNRWLENCYIIKVIVTEYGSFSVDTPEDLQKANNLQ